jgi:hypothetical protein
MKLQAIINMINDWAKNSIIKINQNKSSHITFNLRMHLDRRLTRAKHIETKRNQFSLEVKSNALATRKNNTVNRKQTPPIQSNTQTHMDLRPSAMGDSLYFQHRNPSALPVQDCLFHSECTLIHKQPQD